VYQRRQRRCARSGRSLRANAAPAPRGPVYRALVLRRVPPSRRSSRRSAPLSRRVTSTEAVDASALPSRRVTSTEAVDLRTALPTALPKGHLDRRSRRFALRSPAALPKGDLDRSSRPSHCAPRLPCRRVTSTEAVDASALLSRRVTSAEAGAALHACAYDDWDSGRSRLSNASSGKCEHSVHNRHMLLTVGSPPGVGRSRPSPARAAPRPSTGAAPSASRASTHPARGAGGIWQDNTRGYLCAR